MNNLLLKYTEPTAHNQIASTLPSISEYGKGRCAYFICFSLHPPQPTQVYPTSGRVPSLCHSDPGELGGL